MDEDKTTVVNDDTKDKKERHFVPKKQMIYRKKNCKLCARDATLPSYKNPEGLKKFMTDRGKILPSHLTGTCAKHQRMVAEEIKKARNLALLPFDRK